MKSTKDLTERWWICIFPETKEFDVMLLCDSINTECACESAIAFAKKQGIDPKSITLRITECTIVTASALMEKYGSKINLVFGISADLSAMRETFVHRVATKCGIGHCL